MTNEFEVRGNVTAIFIDHKKHGRLETLIDTDKLGLAMKYKTWTVTFNNKTKTFYAVSRTKVNKKSMMHILHRLVLGSPDKKEVDHINHDTLDNRGSNLRLVTTAENQQNRKGACANSKSGVRGFHRHKKLGKWEVQIRLLGKKKTIGYFSDLEEARKAAIEARRKYMPFSNEDAV